MRLQAIASWVVFLVLMLVLFAGCAPQRVPAPVTRPDQALVEISPELLPLEKDDLNRNLLEQAIRNSLRYYDRLPEDRHLSFGPQRVPVSRAKRSLETFLELLTGSQSWEELADRVRQRFVFYQSVGRDAERKVLFTGYYEPTISGSLTPDDHYRYPVYGVPDDLVQIDLGSFREKYQGVRLVGRYERRRVLPYYSRQEIDSDGLLAGKGYEQVWIADPIDRFFLHIQGSGHIRLVNGESFRINYGASNGWPYNSIGKLLIEKKAIPK